MRILQKQRLSWFRGAEHAFFFVFFSKSIFLPFEGSVIWRLPWKQHLWGGSFFWLRTKLWILCAFQNFSSTMISMEASQSFELRQLQDNWRTPVFSICKTQPRDRQDSADLLICDVQDAECHPFHCLFRAMEASGKRPSPTSPVFPFFFWLRTLTWTGAMPWAFDGTGGSWQNGTSESLDYDRLYIYIWL